MGSSTISSGRGGAGNIVDASKSPRIAAQDLQTPTLKSNVISTGRGGSGNMQKNSDPTETRARQDVNPVERTSSSANQQHGGRGGAGNTFTGDEEKPTDSKGKSS